MLEAKIVTANGDVVIASEYQNDDLFYAMRGRVESVQEFLWDLAIMQWKKINFVIMRLTKIMNYLLKDIKILMFKVNFLINLQFFEKSDF